MPTTAGSNHSPTPAKAAHRNHPFHAPAPPLRHCSGLIPRLYKEGYTGKVYCTEETAEIAKIALLDAVRINKAPFSESHVQAVRWLHPKFENGFSSLTWIAQDLGLAFTVNPRSTPQCKPDLPHTSSLHRKPAVHGASNDPCRPPCYRRPQTAQIR